MILGHTPKYCVYFVYDCLFLDKFQEESRKEFKDDDYAKNSGGLNELHERALLVVHTYIFNQPFENEEYVTHRRKIQI